MNIFNVLSMGKSNIHEPSMSAMLAYLLNPNQNHGLGRKVINSFLELANENNTYDNFINDGSLKFEIDLEVQYSHEKKRNDIDIQIKVLDNAYNELHRIIIENKIRLGAANPKQLESYYQAILKDKDNDDPFTGSDSDLSVIFLTPDATSKGLEEEFKNLDIKNKVWLRWTSEDPSSRTIVTLIQDILKLEQEAKISPINEYMKHTLKAFAHYIIQTIVISSGKNQVGVDIGELKKKKDIEINGKPYTIVLRDSGQIQLFHDGNKIRARKLLRAFLKENKIPEGKTKSTRVFGKQIFNYLEKPPS